MGEKEWFMRGEIDAGAVGGAAWRGAGRVGAWRSQVQWRVAAACAPQDRAPPRTTAAHSVLLPALAADGCPAP